MINKRKDEAFNKSIYLLGTNDGGRNVWLEAPSWDCGWYWGFGYVETYTNNQQPSKSRDIESHQHVDSSVMGANNAKDGGYCHNPFDSKLFTNTTFTESEGWELGELFSQFYQLSESAAMFGRGGCHISTSEKTKGVLTRTAWSNTINQEIIPVVTSRIIEILTPKEK